MAGTGLAPLIGIVEVAARAGVSPATVSRALRGLPGVSATTRLNVERAAAELGYVASPVAAQRQGGSRPAMTADSGFAPLIGIADVAASAGVSPATVSRTLRGYSGVSASTRMKVERAAATLGYVASPSAAALTTGRTGAIGVIAPWSSRWFVSAVVEGMQEVIIDRGYHTLLPPLSMSTASAGSSVIDTRALHKRVDGILAVNVPLGIQSASLHHLRVPVVTIGGCVSGVSVNDRDVGRLATRHLLELGHRRIAFVGRSPHGSFGFPVADDRAAGYADALAEYSLDVDPSMVLTAGPTVEAGVVAMQQLWRQALSEPGRLPTAVFAVTDEVAMGVLHSARNHSIRVPEQLSVIGADNHDLAYLFELTTVGQSAREQGRVAAQMLLDRLSPSMPSQPPRFDRLDPYLIERRTVTVPVDMADSPAAAKPWVNSHSSF